MQEYDVALKLLLQGSARLTMREVIGVPIAKWLDVELPKVENPRVDLLGETAEGDLIHLELQSANEPMELRMAEYSLSVFRLFGRFPRQIVLYVGEPWEITVPTSLIWSQVGRSSSTRIISPPITCAVPTTRPIRSRTAASRASASSPSR